jgi:hypothetical protein
MGMNMEQPFPCAHDGLHGNQRREYLFVPVALIIESLRGESAGQWTYFFPPWGQLACYDCIGNVRACGRKKKSKVFFPPLFPPGEGDYPLLPLRKNRLHTESISLMEPGCQCPSTVSLTAGKEKLVKKVF